MPSPPSRCILRLQCADAIASRPRSRCPLAKFVAYCQYVQHTRPWRHALVILAMPLPSLALSLLAPLIPLQDLGLGVRANTGFFINWFVTITLTVIGCELQIRASTELAHHDFSNADVFLIGVAGGGMSTAIMVAAASLWRFLVPFSIVLIFPLSFVAFLVAHVLVLRGRLLRRDSVIRGPIFAFLLPFTIQASQVVIYLALASVFAASNTMGQVALVILLPFLKYALRAVVRRFTRHIPDGSTETAVSGVEIAAAMYQSVLMQNTPTATATALLMGIDIGQTIVSVFVLMAKPSSIPSNEVVGRAAILVGNKTPIKRDQAMGTTIRPVSTAWAPFKANTVSVHPLVEPTPDASESPIVHHALELFFAAETLVLIEYFEVALPAVNAIFVCIASQLRSAEYGPKLRVYRHRPRELERALFTLMLYTVLQALSVVILHAVVWRRYRISTTTLLAFLLERHAWGLQGKLISWLTLVFQLPLLHYGFDFSFRFDFTLSPLE